MKRNIYLTVIFIFILNINTISSYSAEKKKASEQTTVSVIAVGDIMPGSDYPAEYLPPDDGKDLFNNVKDILRKADIAFGNLEGTFLNQGETVKNCSDPLKCYAFRIPEHYVSLLTAAGFDILSIANNHVGDFGDVGRKNTTEILEKAGLKFAGLIGYPPMVFEKNGVTYGFCAFAPNIGTLDIRDIAEAVKIIKELDSKTDIIIVSFHGGAEGANHRHVTRESEEFCEEDRGNVYEFAHSVIDAGADLVFGHGTHVTRAAELYKERFIAYSLGNFCTYGYFNLNGHNGISPMIEVRVNKKGEFLNGKIYPVKQIKLKGPFIDEDKSAIKEIKELTEGDFPETPLNYSG